MHSFERQEIILNLLKENRNISIKDLSKKLNVALNTIRSDLDMMEKDGLVVRLRGGVSLPSSNVNATNNNIGIRYQKNLNEKILIAKEVIKDFPDDTDFSVFMDSSTSAMQVAKAMSQIPKRCTVITHFTNIAHILGVNPNISVILCGGMWWSNENCVIGPGTIDMLNEYRVDIALVGCTGIQIGDGIFNINIETVPIKRKMIKNAKEAWILCDSSKFGQPSLTKIVDFNEISRIYTDKIPDKKWMEYFDSIQFNVRYPIL